MQVFQQTDHREDAMVLGSEKLALYSLEKVAEGFAFAQLHRKGKKVHTVANKPGLADVGLFRRWKGNHKTALLETRASRIASELSRTAKKLQPCFAASALSSCTTGAGRGDRDRRADEIAPCAPRMIRRKPAPEIHSRNFACQ